jgi:hypothetical protein
VSLIAQPCSPDPLGTGAVGFITLLIYDYFLTLPREVRYIWSTSNGSIKQIFLLQRYLPFVDIIMRLASRKLSSESYLSLQCMYRTEGYYSYFAGDDTYEV